VSCRIIRRSSEKNDRRRGIPPAHRFWSIAMMDAVVIAIGFVFFALSIAYVYACERL